jgi:hypothetical protein
MTLWKSLKRWPVLLALLVVLGGLAVGLVLLPGELPGGRVTRENCERIKEGMTEAEVRAILGKPWDASLLDPEPPRLRFPTAGPAPGFLWWVGKDVVLFVFFEDGRVESTKVLTDLDPPRSWLPQRVWRRLRARYGW